MEKFETQEVAHLSYFFHWNLANEQISICPQAIACCRLCLAESTVESSRTSYFHFNELIHHDLRWAIGVDLLEVDSAEPWWMSTLLNWEKKSIFTPIVMEIHGKNMRFCCVHRQSLSLITLCACNFHYNVVLLLLSISYYVWKIF